MPSLKIPRVHKVTVQQGNVITQEMIDQLKPGMSRIQVAYIMGEPILRSTFNPNRWDYVYTILVPGLFDQQVSMALFFEEDVLAYFTGDMAPTTTTEESDTEATADEEVTADQQESPQDA
ncbi:MAG: outer membrane protein assembly factor BamE [Gammaproteobacteria bacterium]|nr:outer membrane protein assembly factor BamE [Gammaproteobacteria bacterium]